MLSYAAAARRTLGTIEGGDAGAAMVAAADEAFRAQGVRDPEAMARMHVTGFAP
jgi:hypothetical protein